MKELNDVQKIMYVIELNKLDKVTQYQRSKAKRFIMEMFEQAIYEHNIALRRFENDEITWDEMGDIQDNCVRVISMLKMLNEKHNFYKVIK